MELDLVENPDLLLDMNISVRSVFFAMTEGLITGKKLSDYFTESKAQWVDARRIVNGLDRASQIASYGNKFLRCLTREGFQKP